MTTGTGLEKKRKKSPGHPKDPWGPYDTEHKSRLNNGTAAPTLWGEARGLADWAEDQPLITFVRGGALKMFQIAYRLKKRYRNNPSEDPLESYLIMRANFPTTPPPK
jgi:hypothetical protein